MIGDREFTDKPLHVNAKLKDKIDFTYFYLLLFHSNKSQL